jgi:peptide/nickel transport system substrate-binding protein
MHYARTLTLGLACSILVVGTATPTIPATRPLKSLTILQSSEPKALDPSGTFLSHEENVGTQVYDNLAWLDRDLKPDPKLAASWRNVSPLVWEVKLRTGVRFTNGEPFNADALIESFKYMTRPQSAQRARFTAWEAMERVDDFTVRIRTKAPDPRFLITLVQVQVMPPGLLKANPGSLADRPIGTGPFKFVEWVKGERIVLEANDDHWRGRPKVDRLVFKAVPEAAARVAALQAGQADLILNVPPESVELLDRGANTKVISIPSTRNVTIIFDNRTPPFNDARVRQAMNYAVDKDSLNRNILGGRALIQATPSHPLTFGHNAEVKPYPYDPQKAKELLAQAGYPNGFPTEFHHPTGRWLKDVEVAQAVAGMLEKVGVRSRLLTREYNTFFSTWAKGELKGMAMIGTLSQIDADRTVWLFLHSKGNFPHYSKDPKLDALYDQAQTLDLAKRERLLKDMEVYIHQQAPWLFLYFQPDLFGANKKLKWAPPRNERLVLWDADLES